MFHYEKLKLPVLVWKHQNYNNILANNIMFIFIPERQFELYEIKIQLIISLQFHISFMFMFHIVYALNSMHLKGVLMFNQIISLTPHNP